jgi:hypothetical protein
MSADDTKYWCPECKRYQVRLQMIGGDAYGLNTKIFRCDFCAHAWSQRIRDNQREIEILTPSRAPATDPMSQHYGAESCDFCLGDSYSHRAWCPTRADLRDEEQRFIAERAFEILALEARGRIMRIEASGKLDSLLMWQCKRERCRQINSRYAVECGRCQQAHETQSERGVAMVRSYGPGETEFDTYRPYQCAIPRALKMQIMRTKAAAFCDGYYVKAWEHPNTRDQWNAYMRSTSSFYAESYRRSYDRAAVPGYTEIRARILDGDGFDDDEMSGDYLRACQIALEVGR